MHYSRAKMCHTADCRPAGGPNGGLPQQLDGGRGHQVVGNQDLANSHANSWSIGAAQGAFAWRAFREHGTQAIIPVDVAAPAIPNGDLQSAIAATTRLHVLNLQNTVYLGHEV